MFNLLNLFSLNSLLPFFIVSVATIYFLNSNFGNSVQFAKDLKEQTNTYLSKQYDLQSTNFSNTVRQLVGMKTIPNQHEKSSNVLNNSNSLNTINTKLLPTNVNKSTDEQKIDSNTPNISNETINNNNKPNVNSSNITKTIDNTSPVSDKTVSQNDKTDTSGFEIYKIPFYYDNSNAPKNVTKQETLTIVQQAS